MSRSSYVQACGLWGWWQEFVNPEQDGHSESQCSCGGHLPAQMGFGQGHSGGMWDGGL